MNNTNITNARKNLYKVVKQVNETHEPVHIYGKKGNAVIVGEEDWKNIQETLFLASIPGMRESIIKGMEEDPEDCTEELDW
ncbi:MAG: type II toxin-antitoxin system Phd/YefM family antitoxin [Fidelibacterota bacterium]